MAGTDSVYRFLITPLVVIIGLFWLANGTFMLVNPEAWYWAADTVPETGPMNPHFIRDIAFMYLLTAVALLAGVMRPEGRFVWWTAATAWHVCHALFHIWEVIMGICTPAAFAKDFVPVVLPAIVMLPLCWRAYRAV